MKDWNSPDRARQITKTKGDGTGCGLESLFLSCHLAELWHSGTHLPATELTPIFQSAKTWRLLFTAQFPCTKSPSPTYQLISLSVVRQVLYNLFWNYLRSVMKSPVTALSFHTLMRSMAKKPLKCEKKCISYSHHPSVTQHTHFPSANKRSTKAGAFVCLFVWLFVCFRKPLEANLLGLQDYKSLLEAGSAQQGCGWCHLSFTKKQSCII